jgi:DNA-binding CsgD family transcriptional regulator/tetratricopeptide (TPR) repeat protein
VNRAPTPAETRSSRLVGRETERSVLERELAEARVGRPRAVLLTGEAGIGKTRLAAELVRAHGEDAVALTARAYPLGATASLGLWVEALEGHLRVLSSPEVRALCGPHLDDLAALLPAVAGASATRPVAEPPRIRILDGLAHLLRRVSDETVLIVVLDDVHLADGSSWEALNYLAHNLGGSRILLVLAARAVELADQLFGSQTVLALEQEGFLTRLGLGPLAADHLREMAQAVTGQERVTDALVEWLMERSRGAPLFAGGLLRALMDEGADLSRPSLRVLPEDLAERITVAQRQLDPPSRALLEMIAVVGSRVTLGEVRSLSGQPLERLSDLLDGLVRARAIVELEQARELTYEMAHPLVQEAVYRGVGGARRRALHRHVARALVAAGRAGAAAAHFVRSADPGDPEAVDALREALAQADARQLHRESLALLGALLELLPAGDPRWLDVHDAMARLPEWIVDHRTDVGIDIGLDAMWRIDQLVERSDDSCRRAGVKLNLAVFVGWGQGDVESATRLATEARTLFAEAGDVCSELLAINELGYLRWIAGDMVAFETLASEVLERGEATGDRFVVLQGLCALAHNRQLGGDVAGSLPILGRAIRIAREDGRLYRASYLLAQSAFSLALLGRLAEARARLAEGRAANADFRATPLLDYAMQVAWLSGDLATCGTFFDEQLTWTGGHSRRRALGSCVAAIAAAERGDAAAARSIVSAASAVSSGSDARPQSDQMRWAGSVVSWLDGDPGTAAAELAAAIRRQRDGGWGRGPFSGLMLADLAEIGGHTFDPGVAALLDELLAGAGADAEGPALTGIALLTRGAAALAHGDQGEARVHLEAAADRLAVAGWPLLQGRALALLGRATAAADRQLALAVLSRAAGLFEACQAVVRHRRVVEDMHRLGARGRRATAAVAGPAALTRREREVVRLALEGRSSREIAHQLFIGERTVETHLSGAYAKLGVGSRVELVRLAPDLGP